MALQGKDWNLVTSKKNKKKDKDEEIKAAMKQQYADYLHTNKGGVDDIDDISDYDETDYVPETQAGPSNVNAEVQIHEGDTSTGEKRGVEALPAYHAWLKRAIQFDVDPRYQKEDLALIKYEMIKTDLLILDEPDITPVPRGWGACLIGRFAGRFPGKEAIFDLTRRWKCKSRVTFHRKGWLCFQFGSEEEMEKIRQQGPFEIFGIPLVLQPMPRKFDPDMEPEVMVPIWLRLVDLPLDLWNLTAVSKIASCIGTPLSTDFSTLRRETLDGPRIQVIIDTAKKPKESLTIQLPNGGHVEQKIEYEFIPKFCNACKTYGHFADECRGRKEEWDQVHRKRAYQRPMSRNKEKSGSRYPEQQPHRLPNQGHPRGKNVPDAQVQNGRPAHRAGPRERSRSRPRNQMQWKPTGTVYPIVRKDKVLDGPRETTVTEQIPTSPNKFQPLATEGTSDPREIAGAPSANH